VIAAGGSRGTVISVHIAAGLVHRGGLYARVLRGGTIGWGDSITRSG